MRFSIILLLLLLLPGCLFKAPEAVEPVTEAGEVRIYLEPTGLGADPVRFTLGEVAAVTNDGSLLPLRLNLFEIPGAEPGRQRLLASGSLPAGVYQGLSITVNRARILTEEGEAALLSPSEPVKVDLPFHVIKNEATMVGFLYRQAGSLPEAFKFHPRFSARIPEAPVVSRTGYATCGDGGFVTAFDRKTFQIIGFAAAGRRPTGAVFDERLRRAFVAFAGADEIRAIDLASGETLGSLRLQSEDRPERLALTPDGSLLLVANTGSDRVSLIDARSLAELQRFEVADEPREVLVDAAGSRAYVFSVRSALITVIDLARREIVATITTEYGPFRGAFSRDGEKLFVIHRGSPFMTVFDTGGLNQTERIQVGMGVSDILIDSRTDLIYLAFRDQPRVDIYDPFSLLPVDFLEAPRGIADMVIDDEENTLFLAAPMPHGVVVIDLTGKRTLGRMEVGEGAHSLALMGMRH